MFKLTAQMAILVLLLNGCAGMAGNTQGVGGSNAFTDAAISAIPFVGGPILFFKNSASGGGAQSEKDLADKKFQEIAAREGNQPPPTIQSSAPACPGWALVHIALRHPMAKAMDIIEKQTTAKRSWLDYDTSPEMVAVSEIIKQTCTNPDPSVNYRKLGWVCPPGDPECPKKEAFVKEFDALKSIADRDINMYLQQFKVLVQRYKSESI